MATLLQLGHPLLEEGGGIGPIGPGGDPHHFKVFNLKYLIQPAGTGPGIPFKTLKDLRLSLPKTAQGIAKLVIVAGGAVNSRQEVIFVNKDLLAKTPGSKLLMFDAATVKAAGAHVAVGISLGIQVEVPSLETEKPTVSSVLQAPSNSRKPAKKRAVR